MALCAGSGIWDGARYPRVYVRIHMCESLFIFLACKPKQQTRSTMSRVNCDVLQDYKRLRLKHNPLLLVRGTINNDGINSHCHATDPYHGNERCCL